MSGRSSCSALLVAAALASPAAAQDAAPPPQEGAAPGGPAVRAEAEPLRERAGWYLSIMLGWGGGPVERRDGSVAFGPAATNVPIPLAGAIQIGIPVGRRLLVGAELNLTYAVHTVANADPNQTPSIDRTLTVAQLFATATWYPLERPDLDAGARELAPRGWYVRAGVGTASLSSSPDADAAPPGAPTWDRSGLGLLAGSGWAFWVGRSHTRTIDVAIDLTWQRYGASAAEPESSLLVGVSGGLAFF